MACGWWQRADHPGDRPGLPSMLGTRPVFAVMTHMALPKMLKGSEGSAVHEHWPSLQDDAETRTSRTDESGLTHVRKGLMILAFMCPHLGELSQDLSRARGAMVPQHPLEGRRYKTFYKIECSCQGRKRHSQNFCRGHSKARLRLLAVTFIRRTGTTKLSSCG